MNVKTREPITFAVHPVKPATEPLKTIKTYEAIKKMAGGPIEACSDYTGEFVEDVHYHPLMAAVHLAFSRHRPLVLSPDMIWITILQGFAHHVSNNSEQMRELFVEHQGKLKLVVGRVDFIFGSPDNDWPSLFAQFSEQIREHVGPVHEKLRAEFSTTGSLERAVGDLVIMDAMQPYFDYEMRCICGIPEITLEGTPEDWELLCEKAAGLEEFKLKWWTDRLVPICEHFARAARGDVDEKHWRNIYKQEDAYGGAIINGWIACLLPYIKDSQTYACTLRNPMLESDGDPEWGLSSENIPGGLSEVPLTWISQTEERIMKLLGGLPGVTQDRETLALRPRIGWAVLEANHERQLLHRLQKTAQIEPALSIKEMRFLYLSRFLNAILPSL